MRMNSSAGPRLVGPAWILFFLSPGIGELLSGSSPPAEFFNPISLLILAALYGSGAILIRELAFRWRKGWPTILTLGLAYGILEEGLMVKSFFDPNWMDLGFLGSYGRWLGVNWVWSVELTLYHALFSIAIPIFLVNLMFPKQVNRSWIGRKTFWALVVLLGFDVLIGFFWLSEYDPPLPHYSLAVCLVVGLILLARRLPESLVEARTPGSIRSPVLYGALGFIGTAALFIANWLMPTTGLPAGIAAALNVGLAILVLLGVFIFSDGGSAWNWRHQFALVAGGLGFFILLGPVQEMDPTRIDNTGGMTLVAAAAALALTLLYLLRRRAERRISCRYRGTEGSG